MKRLSVGKMIGIAGVLFGGYGVVMALVPPLYRFIGEKKDAFDYVFMLTIIPLMALPGIIAVYFGSRLTRTPNERNIKWTLGAGAVFLAIFLSCLLEWLAPILKTISRSQSVTLAYRHVARDTFVCAGLSGGDAKRRPGGRTLQSLFKPGDYFYRRLSALNDWGRTY